MTRLINTIWNVINKCVQTLTPSKELSLNLMYRPDIDGLRAIAVSGVLLFHAFPTHLTGGFVGVDIFFVISGYLISSIIYSEINAGSFSFVQFYGRRVRRIFPSLIVVLVACYLAGWYFLLPVEYKKLGAHIAAASVFFSNFLLCGESGYFDDASDTKPLLHLWSLGIEEQFYIIWPVLFYILWKTKMNLLTATIMLTLSSFTLNIIKVKTDSVQTFYWPTTRAWELLIGSCLAVMLRHTNDYFESIIRRFDSLLIALIYSEVSEPNGTTLRNVMSITGALFIALAMGFLTKSSVFPGWWAIAPTIGSALLISVGPTPWINRVILSSNLLTKIGQISYPLYLWHWPLLIYMRFIGGYRASTYTSIAVLFLSILLAWITDAFIDRNFRFGRFTNIKVVFLCVFIAGIGLIGYYTYRADGLPYRLPKLIQDIKNHEKYIGSYLQQYRQFKCFLEPHQDESKFGACVDNIEKPASSALILWGDSHAAHLYPGIVAAKPDIRVTQLTMGLCAPLLEVQIKQNPRCYQINNYVFKRILIEKPNTVVLAASWTGYDWKSLTKTIANLRNTTVKDIYLVGPVPQWHNGLPRCLYDYFLQDKLHRVPNRMHVGLIPKVDSLDEEMQEFATRAKINYISPYKILCTSNGCLTRTGEGADTLTAWDYAHLTIAGSTFVVSHFPKILLQPTSTV